MNCLNRICQKSSEHQSLLRLSCEIELSIHEHAHFPNHILQQGPRVTAFYMCCLRSGSPYSLMNILATLSSKRAPNVTVFEHLDRIVATAQLVHFWSTTFAYPGNE